MTAAVPRLRSVPSALATLASLAACDDLRPLRPLATDLTVPLRASLPDAVPLAPVDLASQAGLDAFEQRWLPRPGAAALAAFLEGLSDDPGLPIRHPLLLQRIALLRADAAAQRGDGLEGVIRAGTRLREAAPGSADTLFVEGYIPWRFIVPETGAARPLALTADLVPFAESVRDRWRALLAATPSWRGPRGLDASWIVARLAEVDAALAARTGSVSPPPPASGATSPPEVAFDPSRLAAAEALARFDASPDGERRGLCASWRPHLPAAQAVAGASPESFALALRCATLAGEAGLAVTALASLLALEEAEAAPPGSAAACSLREALVLRFGEGVVAAESSRLGLGLRCPPAAAQPL